MGFIPHIELDVINRFGILFPWDLLVIYLSVTNRLNSGKVVFLAWIAIYKLKIRIKKSGLILWISWNIPEFTLVPKFGFQNGYFLKNRILGEFWDTWKISKFNLVMILVTNGNLVNFPQKITNLEYLVLLPVLRRPTKH